MSATRTEIDARVARLSELIGKDLHVSTWSPGDGWTRYQLLDANYQPALGGRYYRKGEFYEALGMALNVVYIMNGQVN